ncbi:hypothetical protein DPEC_G00361580 [Dallia pectoralis]|nr:hypothetical protein DPEC_G00361580 [Dallia pectoralis]
MLPQFLAMYRITVENEETYLVVMRNMFSHRLVHRKYDLKGSRTLAFDTTSWPRLPIWPRLAGRGRDFPTAWPRLPSWPRLAYAVAWHWQ